MKSIFARPFAISFGEDNHAEAVIDGYMNLISRSKSCGGARKGVETARAAYREDKRLVAGSDFSLTGRLASKQQTQVTQ